MSNNTPVFVPIICKTCIVNSACTKSYDDESLCRKAFAELIIFIKRVEELDSIYGLHGYKSDLKVDSRVEEYLTDDRYSYAEELIKLFRMFDCKKVCPLYSDKQYEKCFGDINGDRLWCDPYNIILREIRHNYTYENLLNKYIENYVNKREYNLFSEDDI